MDTQLVKLEIPEPHVGIVTIDNPPVNAHSIQVLDEIALAFDVISDRDDIRVAILTGAGKVFCAGADIKERTRSESRDGDTGSTAAVRARPITASWSARSLS